jgi:hypothetical protein
MAPFPVAQLDDFNRADNASLGADWTEAVNGKTNRPEISGNRVTVVGAGSSGMAAYTGTGAPSGLEMAVQATAFFTSSTVVDAHGLGVTKVSDTTKGYHCEFDNQGTDVVVHIVNDSTATDLLALTITGYGKLLTGDKIGFVAHDAGSQCNLEVWLERTGVWTQVATVSASGAEYIAGPYYASLRVKYDVEALDDFSAAQIVASPTTLRRLSAGLRW